MADNDTQEWQSRYYKLSNDFAVSRATRKFRAKVRGRRNAASLRRMREQLKAHSKRAKDIQAELYVALLRAEEELRGAQAKVRTLSIGMHDAIAWLLELGCDDIEDPRPDRFTELAGPDSD